MCGCISNHVFPYHIRDAESCHEQALAPVLPCHCAQGMSSEVQSSCLFAV